jgi:ribosomal protein L34
MSKYTLNGSKKKAIKKSGFRARNSSKSGRKILKKRRLKKRLKLTVN